MTLSPYKVTSATGKITKHIHAQSPSDAGRKFCGDVWDFSAPDISTEPIPDGPQRLGFEGNNRPHLLVTAACGSRFALYVR